MQLLLILSAMLSALTGAIGGRVPDLRSHHAAVLRDAAVSAPRRIVTRRPVAARPTLVETAPRLPETTLGFARRVPLYAARRRQ